MDCVVRAQLEGIGSALCEIHERCYSIQIREANRRWSGIKFPQNGRRSAWIDNRASECRAERIDVLVAAGIYAWRTR